MTKTRELKHPLTKELSLVLVGTDPPQPKVGRLLLKIDRELTTVPETWGAVRAAEYMGVRHNNLYKMKGLPEPIEETPHKRWLAADIRAWAKRRGN